MREVYLDISIQAYVMRCFPLRSLPWSDTWLGLGGVELEAKFSDVGVDGVECCSDAGVVRDEVDVVERARDRSGSKRTPCADHTDPLQRC